MMGETGVCVKVGSRGRPTVTCQAHIVTRNPGEADLATIVVIVKLKALWAWPKRLVTTRAGALQIPHVKVDPIVNSAFGGWGCHWSRFYHLGIHDLVYRSREVLLPGVGGPSQLGSQRVSINVFGLMTSRRLYRLLVVALRIPHDFPVSSLAFNH